MFSTQLPSRREIPEPAVWQVLHDVGQALQHVHGMQLVHLDVKPANLLIGDEGLSFRRCPYQTSPLWLACELGSSRHSVLVLFWRTYIHTCIQGQSWVTSRSNVFLVSFEWAAHFSLLDPHCFVVAFSFFFNLTLFSSMNVRTREENNRLPLLPQQSHASTLSYTRAHTTSPSSRQCRVDCFPVLSSDQLDYISFHQDVLYNMRILKRFLTGSNYRHCCPFDKPVQLRGGLDQLLLPQDRLYACETLFPLCVSVVSALVLYCNARYCRSQFHLPLGGRLKLADFGMATVYGEGADGFGDGQEGDTLYMAKELLSSTKRVPSADMFRYTPSNGKLCLSSPGLSFFGP